MEAILGQLPQVVGLIEKGGVIGLLVIFCAVLIWEIKRARKHNHEMRDELHRVYAQRERWRLAYVKCKSACDAAKITVDLSDLADLIEEAK